jgi:hypothetical protein
VSEDPITEAPSEAVEKARGPGEQPAPVSYDAAMLGSTGLRAFGGFVQEDFLPELMGVRGARTYRQMADNDPIVGALIFAISMLIRQVEWSVKAVDESDEAQAAKDFVEECIADMETSWASVMAEVCTMFVYGYAPMEVAWKRRVGPHEMD